MQKKCFLLFFLLLSFSNIANLEINEVMFSPTQCSERTCEWVEIYNPSENPINLTTWKISDSKSVDNLSCCGNQTCSLSIPAKEYVVILDQDTTLPKGKNTFCVDDKTIGNGLGNSGDHLTIFNETYNHSMDYDGSFGKNSYTLEKRSDGTWGESLEINGTFGSKNSISELSSQYKYLIISEFMANPFGLDDELKPYGEWVELFNKGTKSLDLRGLKITDQKKENEIIIAQNKLEGGDTIICGGCYKTIYRDGDSDFSLNSDFDEVNLYHEQSLIDSITYSGAVEGMSFSVIESNLELTQSTPSERNKGSSKCDWKLELNMNNSILSKSDSKFTLRVNRNMGFPNNVTVKGEITDFFGKVVKEYTPFTQKAITSTAIKHYSPHLPRGIYQAKFWFENLSCEDNDLANNEVTKLFAINPTFGKNISSLLIEKIYEGSDKHVKWGEQFNVKVNVYKGDETRKSVQVWAEMNGEKISKTSKIIIGEPFRDYPLTIPLQLIPNCAQKIKGETAQVVIQAFGLEEKSKFTIKDLDPVVCKGYFETPSNTLNSKLQYNLIDLQSTVFQDEILHLKLNISNENKSNTLKIWPYLYRGSKCYSCGEKEQNHLIQEIRIGANQEKTLDFFIKIDEDTGEGAYKLKVKILKKGLKTAKQITEPIYIKPKKEEAQEKNLILSVLTQKSGGEQEDKTLTPKKTFQPEQGVVVYESNSMKAKNLVPYLLIGAFALLSLTLAFRKT